MLKKILSATVVSTALLFCTACSCGNSCWTNRLDDAKDLVSFTVGRGWGIKVQAGPLHADTMYNYAPIAGLRGGEFFQSVPHSDDYHVEEGNIGVPFLFANMEIFYPDRHAAERGKAYCAMTPLLPIFVLCPEQHSAKFCNSCSWKRKRDGRNKSEKLPPEQTAQTSPETEKELSGTEESRKKAPCWNLPFDGRRAWYKYSDIEVTAAFFRGFSIGFNPGELLDFLAGFIGLDIYGDDL